MRLLKKSKRANKKQTKTKQNKKTEKKPAVGLSLSENEPINKRLKTIAPVVLTCLFDSPVFLHDYFVILFYFYRH